MEVFCRAWICLQFGIRTNCFRFILSKKVNFLRSKIFCRAWNCLWFRMWTKYLQLVLSEIANFLIIQRVGHKPTQIRITTTNLQWKSILQSMKLSSILFANVLFPVSNFKNYEFFSFREDRSQKWMAKLFVEREIVSNLVCKRIVCKPRIDHNSKKEIYKKR